MATVYLLVKFLHVISSTVWIGGVVAMAILIARIAGETDPTLLVALTRQARFYGGAVITPAIGVQLLTGLVMIFGFGFGLSLWVLWGIAAILVVVVLSLTLLVPAFNAIIDGATSTQGDQQLTKQQRRLVMLYGIILLVLLSAEWAMVFKPTL
jgi:uncharacterized membrane protein